MKTRVKVLIGGIAGMITMSFISSTYFYNFLKKSMNGLKTSLKDYNY
jgi:hypothetical protein